MALLEISGVAKRFGGILAVDGISCELAEGRITGLIGPNGAGKTTLFNLVTGFLPVDRGAVRYRGREITGLPPYQIANLGIARSFQDLRVFARMTVVDNVMLARQRQPGENIALALFGFGRVSAQEKLNRERVMDYLEFVRLADKAHELAENLSYAEQKLLVIARLLATEADLLLLDEPTSGLDPNTVGEMIELVRGLITRGKTVCIIEHNLDVVKDLSDWIVFLDQGQAVAAGRPEDIMSDRKLAEIYFGT
jgi:ABC-type branched-subunit amino acid transport system ATPase component